MTQPEGVRQNPDHTGGRPGSTLSAGNQPPAGYPFPPPQQPFGAPHPQATYQVPQVSWHPPAQPGAWVPTPPPSRSWLQRKRFAIPAGVLALGMLGAAVAPTVNTDSAPADSSSGIAADTPAPAVEPSPAPAPPVEEVAPAP